MPFSVFEVVCPTCGGRMEVSGRDDVRCPACDRSFWLRVGHLIPVPHPPSARKADDRTEERIS